MPSRINDQVDLATGRERHSRKARALKLPKYGQITTESRLFRVPSRRHLKFPFPVSKSPYYWRNAVFQGLHACTLRNIQ